MAEENGLEVAGQLASVGVPSAAIGEPTTASTVVDLNSLLRRSIFYNDTLAAIYLL